MLGTLKSRAAVMAAALCTAVAFASPAKAIALYALVTGTYDPIADAAERQLWEDLTSFSAADLASGGSFTGTIYIDKVVLGDPAQDNNESPTTASFNPYPNFLSSTPPALPVGSFISLTLTINGNTFRGGKEPLAPDVVEYKIEEILGRIDSLGDTTHDGAGQPTGNTSDDTLSFTSNYSGLNGPGFTQARSITYTFEGLGFIDELPDPANPPKLSELLFGSSSTMTIASLITPNDDDTGDISSTLLGRITGASDLMTLEQLLSQTANGGGGSPTQTGAGTAESPLLPVFGEGEEPNGTYNFTIDNIGLFGLGTEIPIFIDPEIAIGYRFTVQPGDPLFATVTTPLLNDLNNQFLIDFTGNPGSPIAIAPGSTFDFTTFVSGGVSEFVITDILTDPPLLANDPQAFMAGVTFVTGSTSPTSANVTMQAIIQPSSGGPMDIAEPGSLSLAAVGLIALWRQRRRYACKAA